MLFSYRESSPVSFLRQLLLFSMCVFLRLLFCVFCVFRFPPSDRSKITSSLSIKPPEVEGHSFVSFLHVGLWDLQRREGTEGGLERDIQCCAYQRSEPKALIARVVSPRFRLFCRFAVRGNCLGVLSVGVDQGNYF